MNSKKIWIALFSLIVLSLFRVIPHPPNFTPMISAGLFAGAYIAPRWLRYLLPLGAMLVSDLWLGLHQGMFFVYMALLASILIGEKVLNFKQKWSIASSSLMGSLVFYAVSNFGVWATSGMYSFDLSGLINCYTLALPFLASTLASTLIYSFATGYAVDLLEKKIQAPYSTAL